MRKIFALAVVVLSFTGCAVLQKGTVAGHSTGAIYDDPSEGTPVFVERTETKTDADGNTVTVVTREPKPVVQAEAYGPMAMDDAGEFAKHAGNYLLKRSVANIYKRWGMGSWYTAGYAQPPAERKAEKEEAKTLELRKEALKACVKTGMSLADCSASVGIGKAPEEKPAVQTESASTDQPAQAVSATATSTVPAVPASDATATQPSANSVDNFAEFKQKLTNAKTKNQMIEAFTWASDHAATEDAKKLFKEQADNAKALKTREDALEFKKTAIESAEQYKALIQ